MWGKMEGCVCVHYIQWLKILPFSKVLISIITSPKAFSSSWLSPWMLSGYNGTCLQSSAEVHESYSNFSAAKCEHTPKKKALLSASFHADNLCLNVLLFVIEIMQHFFALSHCWVAGVEAAVQQWVFIIISRVLKIAHVSVYLSICLS